VLEQIAFSPESLEHPEIRERIYFWSRQLRDAPGDKALIELVNNVSKALAGKLKKRGPKFRFTGIEAHQIKICLRLAHDCLKPHYREMRTKCSRSKGSIEHILKEHARHFFPSCLKKIRPHGLGFYMFMTDSISSNLGGVLSDPGPAAQLNGLSRVLLYLPMSMPLRSLQFGGGFALAHPRVLVSLVLEIGQDHPCPGRGLGADHLFHQHQHEGDYRYDPDQTAQAWPVEADYVHSRHPWQTGEAQKADAFVFALILLHAPAALDISPISRREDSFYGLAICPGILGIPGIARCWGCCGCYSDLLPACGWTRGWTGPLFLYWLDRSWTNHPTTKKGSSQIAGTL